MSSCFDYRTRAIISPLLITIHSSILTICKGRIFWKNLLEKTFLTFKKWVKNIQTEGYNGACTVDEFWLFNKGIVNFVALPWKIENPYCHFDRFWSCGPWWNIDRRTFGSSAQWFLFSSVWCETIWPVFRHCIYVRTVSCFPCWSPLVFWNIN